MASVLIIDDEPDARLRIERAGRAAKQQLERAVDRRERRAKLVAYRRHHLAPQALEEAVAIYRRHYAAGGWAENTPYDGIAEALVALAARHPLYLATSKREDFARLILDHFGFSQYFRALYGARLDGTLSHKPEMVAQILADHRLDPARTIAKYEAFGRMAPDSDAARAFVRLEDWANAGEPLPLACARDLFDRFIS